MPKTLTAANSVFMLAIPGLYPIPQKIEGFATDDAFATGDVSSAEVVKGVDGKMSAAYMPFITEQTIMIQADSPSLEIFENWLAAQDTAREVLPCNATIVLPGNGRKYAMTNGYMTSTTPIVTVKKTLQPGKFVISWDKVTGANI